MYLQPNANLPTHRKPYNARAKSEKKTFKSSIFESNIFDKPIIDLKKNQRGGYEGLPERPTSATFSKKNASDFENKTLFLLKNGPHR